MKKGVLVKKNMTAALWCHFTVGRTELYNGGDHVNIRHLDAQFRDSAEYLKYAAYNV